MLKTRSPSAIVVTCLVLTSAACAAVPPPVAPPAATDRENLVAALADLGPAAAACAVSPPPNLTAAGLELLTRHAPEWLDALGGVPPSGASGSGGETSAGASFAPAASDTAVGAGCEPGLLDRDLGRVRALSVRLSGEDAVARAVARASGADEAILFDALAGGQPPAAEDLATLDPEDLSDLALAEDQAGFVGEYLAAQSPDPELAARLEAAAALHSSRGQTLADLGGGPDPRQPAYQLGAPPAGPDAIRERWAAVELALASHYAALPDGAADPLLTWQLVEAATWGAELPALPFLA
ncbi:MAG: hypothetical protein LBC97_14930 [Bifidobacteriaceae bacterium]|jgi:hypothetical protein|nr:hypothetical protein [Bifidobacteriaceae bacterium]